ncbi:ATP-binding protein [Streptomyces sp. NPDC048192]|uniref:ATP-binding protein n=1 Tax=Streptomyces sp. NPDC048192 TaxID=3365510 RepID=UPI00371E51EB
MNQEATASEDQLDSSIPHFCVRLSPTPRGARLARLLSEQQLRTWRLPLERAAQIVAELAANAVTHGRVPGRDFRLLLYVVGDRLRIEVTDTRGDRLPRLQRSAGDSEPGRGLHLVDALADRWGVAHGRHRARPCGPRCPSARRKPVADVPVRRVWPTRVCRPDCQWGVAGS